MELTGRSASTNRVEPVNSPVVLRSIDRSKLVPSLGYGETYKMIFMYLS